MNNALDEGQALAPINQEEVEVAISEEQYEDAAALKIVLQDTIAAETYLTSKSLVQQWDTDDDIYRAYVKPKTWPNSEIPRANLGMPIVMEIIDNHLLPSVHMAFFSDKQPFLLEPKGKTSNEAAEAMSKLLMWAIRQSDFKEEIRLVEKSILQYGYGLGKWGWETCTEDLITYELAGQPAAVPAGPDQVSIETEASDTVISKIVPQVISKPTFSQINLRNVLVDPTCNRQDCRKARFIIFQSFTDVDGLQELRDTEGYKNIPSDEELTQILTAKNEPTKNSLRASQSNRFHEFDAQKPQEQVVSDPLKQPLELLEYWTHDSVVTVLQRTIIIRNEKHGLGRIPFNGCAFVDVLNSMYGYGVTKLLNGEQRFQQGVVNSWIDGLALKLNPAFQTQKGLTNSRQNISIAPGLVVNEQAELKPLSTETVSAEALNAIANSEARATRRVAANGGTELPSAALRTAEGVQAFSASLTTKLQYFIEIFADLVFIPVLEAFVEMCKAKLKPSDIRRILAETDAKAFEGNILDIYNGTFSFEVLSSTKLAARKASASVLPLLIQLFSAQPVQDSLVTQKKKVDYEYVLEEALELSGWPVDRVVVDMTDADMQRATQQQPAAVKGQADASLLAQKHQFDLENIQEQGMAKAGVKVVQAILKQAEENGQPIG